MDGEKYIEVIRPFLNDKRFYHSLCVAEEAVKLAKKYGADEEKAYTAGILHDITKQTKPEIQLQIIEKSSIICDTMSKTTEKLLHSKSGAAYISETLHIKDDEIINAVCFHTTARANMTLLEKVLYIADFISADRDYPDVDVMRKKSYTSLGEGLKYALSYTILELVEKKKPIHPDTFSAYNCYISD